MNIQTQGLVAVAIMFLATIAISIMIARERRKYRDDFDGGYNHDNKPLAITKIKSNFIEEDNDHNS
jgi:hypothetical protein